MPLPITYKIEEVYSNRYATFAVPTRDQGDVYMSVGRTNYLNDERIVVVVDAEKFLELWKAEPYSLHTELAHGSPSTWPLDYKFKHAVDGFSRGPSNPVPLADVGCDIHIKTTPIYARNFFFFKKHVGDQTESIPNVGFTNGVTRTIWLLYHGAKYFPVLTNKSGANLLNQFAGIPNGEPMSVDQLIPELTRPQYG